MKTEANWLELIVLLTIVLLTTLSIVGINLFNSDDFANDNSGKLALTITERPKTAESSNAINYENG